jgi:hypothetical protein
VRVKLCAECDGYGDHLCHYHQWEYDERERSEALAALEDHFWDNKEVELWLASYCYPI